MITINPTLLDLGEVKAKHDTFFEVTVKNTSDETLKVTAQGSCSSCTFLQSAPENIPSGGEGYYKFRFHPELPGISVKSIFFSVREKVEQTLPFKAQVV